MERSIIASMTNSKLYFKTIILFIVFLFIFIFRNNIFYLFCLINTSVKKENNNLVTENSILKEKCEYFEQELKSITNLKNYANYDYSLTRMSYRLSYTSDEIRIFNTDNIKVNDILINQYGLVGLVKTVKDKVSDVLLLTGVKNLSVNINSSYGTLSGYESGYFVIKNISNYDDVSINDSVYTSTLGEVKEKIYIGKVADIKITDIEKILYVKSDVDFNNINYLYVVG